MPSFTIERFAVEKFINGKNLIEREYHRDSVIMLVRFFKDTEGKEATLKKGIVLDFPSDDHITLPKSRFDRTRAKYKVRVVLVPLNNLEYLITIPIFRFTFADTVRVCSIKFGSFWRITPKSHNTFHE